MVFLFFAGIAKSYPHWFPKMGKTKLRRRAWKQDGSGLIRSNTSVFSKLHAPKRSFLIPFFG
jgi:hypothetical protein